jgi:N-glycosylase/DNA lyase
MLKLERNGLQLADTLSCGQCFRWEQTEAGWQGIVGKRVVAALEESDGTLTLSGLGGYCPETEEAFWKSYFALDLDYPALQHKISAAHPRLSACVSAAPGIRVLRQPFFETLLTFLISQNNNIPRIRGIVARLCEGLGEPIGGGFYAFPEPERLAACSPEDLGFLRAGWRAAYLVDAAQQVASGHITESLLRTLPTPDARLALQGIKGVGPKVADCTLLYGLGRWDAYPVDVWMKRADRALFTARVKNAAEYLNRRTEGYAGIAQQYIFAWARAGGLD